MREMDWTDAAKVRSEEEQVLLARSARNRFQKAVASGQIRIQSKQEWTLR